MKSVRTGIDIVECERFERLLQKKSFLHGVYTERELSYIASKGKSKAQSAAGIFCAKEALLKACGIGIFSARLTEIEVCHDERGKPYLALHGAAKKRFRDDAFDLSISHCKAYAVAAVVAAARDKAENEDEGRGKV